MSKEVRSTPRSPLEVRSDGDTRVAFGYAAKFNVFSGDLGGFVEEIAPSAFHKTLREANVVALFNHDPNQVLGRTSARTLSLEVDDVGLHYEVVLPRSPLGLSVGEMLARGDVDGSSFAFRVVKDIWDVTEEGFATRTLLEVALYDVGPVTFPAYPDASSAVRSLAEARSVDVSTVLEAASSGTLPDLIRGDQASSRPKGTRPRYLHITQPINKG